MKTPFNEEEMTVLLESAWFAMRQKNDELCEYLSASDNYIKKIQNKLDTYLNNGEKN
jgi:hypothetical protein